MELKKARLIKLIIFIAFWIITIINIITRFSAFNLILNLLLFLPVTIFIVLDRDVPALLILIIYFVFMCILQVLGVISGIQNKSYQIINYIFSAIIMVYYLGMMLYAVKILSNKGKIPNKYLLICFLVFFICILVSNIIDALNGNNTDWFSFIGTALFEILIITYFVFYDKNDIEIFK